jgi:hypothetical protein
LPNVGKFEKLVSILSLKKQYNVERGKYRLFMTRQIPVWAKNLGKYGLVVFAGFLFVKYTAEIIFQAEVENWWNADAKPWLFSKKEIQLDLFVWQILLFVLVIVILTGVIIFLFNKATVKNQTPLEQFRQGKIPEHIKATGLSTSDIVSAVVSTRKGIMKLDDLSNLVISATNSSLINKDVAARTLKEFGYSLVYLGDNKYASIKLMGSDVQEL